MRTVDRIIEMCRPIIRYHILECGCACVSEDSVPRARRNWCSGMRCTTQRLEAAGLSSEEVDSLVQEIRLAHEAEEMLIAMDMREHGQHMRVAIASLREDSDGW